MQSLPTNYVEENRSPRTLVLSDLGVRSFVGVTVVHG